MEESAFRTETYEISPRYRLIMSMMLMSHICRRFEKGEKPYTALELKLKTNIPIRVAQELIYELTNMHMVSEVTSDEKGEESVYQPAEDLARLSVGLLIERYESAGKWEISLNLKDADHGKWNATIANHARYIEAQKNILLKDL